MLKLEIVTPERRVVETEAESVTVPTASGEAGILPNHAPLVSALRPGVLSYTLRGTTEKFAIAGGFVEVNHDKVSVLAGSAEAADEVDTAKARIDREAAEKALTAASAQPVEETEALRDQLDAANARLQLSAGGR
jgi:F-type H+-transporting ATPase subunit epsilon